MQSTEPLPSLRLSKARAADQYTSYGSQAKTGLESLSGLKLSGFGLDGENPPLSLRGKSLNEFVTAVHYAFCDEVPMQLSPDIIWLAITQAFGIHVTQNAEKLRGKLVNFDSGKKKLRARDDSLVLDKTDNDWTSVFDQLATGIGEYAGGETVDLLTCEFSTTTPTSRLASQVVLFEAMSKYFSYSTCTRCGIPEIFLDGTVEDWERVRAKAEMLRKFEIDWWLDHLLPVLDEFVLTARHLKSGEPLGEATRNFWPHFYHYGNASGGAHVNGWFNVFFPYTCSNGDESSFNQNGSVDWNGRSKYSTTKEALAKYESLDHSDRTDAFVGFSDYNQPDQKQVHQALTELGLTPSDPSTWEKCGDYGNQGYKLDLPKDQREKLFNEIKVLSVKGTKMVWEKNSRLPPESQPCVYTTSPIGPWDRINGMVLEQAKASLVQFENYVSERGWGGNGPGVYPPSYTNTPMVWEYLGNDIDMIMRAGFLGTQQCPKTRAIRPAIGWAVARKDGSSEGPPARASKKSRMGW